VLERRHTQGRLRASEPRRKADWCDFTQDSGPRPGILIVDSSPEIRDLLEKLLPRHGLNVWIAGNCLQAVDIYWHAHSQIQLVVLEADMPGIDGPQTLLALRGIKPNVRCCFMSACQDKYTVADLISLGAAQTFVKPFRLSNFVHTLRQLAGLASPGAGPWLEPSSN